MEHKYREVGGCWDNEPDNLFLYTMHRCSWRVSVAMLSCFRQKWLATMRRDDTGQQAIINPTNDSRRIVNRCRWNKIDHQLVLAWWSAWFDVRKSVPVWSKSISARLNEVKAIIILQYWICGTKESQSSALVYNHAYQAKQRWTNRGLPDQDLLFTPSDIRKGTISAHCFSIAAA